MQMILRQLYELLVLVLDYMQLSLKEVVVFVYIICESD